MSTRNLFCLAVLTWGEFFGVNKAFADPQTAEEKAILAQVEQINRAWQADNGEEIMRTVLSDKNCTVLVPRPEQSMPTVLDKEAFCGLLGQALKQNRPRKHVHQVQNITIIGPLAYEIGVTEHVDQNGQGSHTRIMNVFAKEDVGWCLVVSAPADQVQQAFAEADAHNEQSAAPADEKLDAAQTAQREEAVRGEFGGIGLQLKESNGQVIVSGAMPGTPAERAGIEADSTLLAVNGLSTQGMKIDDAVKLLRGPAGTTVSLRLRTAKGAVKTVELVREQIVVGKPAPRLLEGSIGLVTMSGFTQATPNTLQEVVKELQDQGAKALIVDLRGNQGGPLDAIDAAAGLFLRQGDGLWFMENKEGSRQLRKAPRSGPITMPVAVLVDNDSRGGELLAAALKRNRRAVVIGHHTSGKTAGRSLVKNPDGSSTLTETTKFLITPTEPITGRGLEPDKSLAPNAGPEEFIQAAVSELQKTLGDKKQTVPPADKSHTPTRRP